MYLNSKLNNIETICINLENRPDKRKWMQKQCNRRKIKIKFFLAKLHENPKRGCLESHITVIKDAIKRKVKYLFVLEDDAKFLQSLDKTKIPPDDWDMLYLGGTVRSRYGSIKDDWVRMACWTTHAYIINLTNKKLVSDILNAVNYTREIDNFYIEKIHSKYKCYMHNPMSIIQREGYSDIEKANVNYDFMQSSLYGFTQPEHKVVDGNYVLKLDNINDDDLPEVTIVTPTYNRRKLFSLAIKNFYDFNYPRNKMKWVIIDDSDDGGVEDLIDKSDKRIEYVDLRELQKRVTIGQKRNIGADMAGTEFILHMDDDDYYPAESILARVKLLIKYSDTIGCVGCSEIGTYNIIEDTSSLASDGPMSLSEASMAYTKKFWEEQGFDRFVEKGEYASFIQNRFEKVMTMPYSFVIYAISHGNNFTKRSNNKNILKYKNKNESVNFMKTWDEETQYFIKELRNYLLKSSNNVVEEC